MMGRDTRGRNLRNIRREVRQLASPPSAFTIGDLLDVARSDQPHARLEHIYEWYFKRTMNASRVTFAASGATAVALYSLMTGNSDKDGHGFVSVALACGVVASALAGFIQLRQLAQLHRELATAHRLLAEMLDLAPRHLRDTRGLEYAHKRKTRRAPAVALLLGLAAFVVIAPVLAGDPETALILVATTILVALVAVLYFEITAPESELAGDSVFYSLRAVVGDIRLDEYVLHHEATVQVDVAIAARR